MTFNLFLSHCVVGRLVFVLRHLWASAACGQGPKLLILEILKLKPHSCRVSKKTANYAQLVALLILFDKTSSDSIVSDHDTLESALLESRLVMTQVADDVTVTPTETGSYLIACPSFQLRFPNLS